MTEAERYIDEQLESELRMGETIEHRGYLESVMKGGALSAFRAKGYLTAFTDQRLLLIQTKVGAFKPVLDNKGVTAYEYDDIEAVSVRKRMVVIATKDGRQLQLVGKHFKKKYLPGLDGLLSVLQSKWGGSEAAKKMGRKVRLKQIIGGLVIVVIAVVFGIYSFKKGRAKVKVECLSGIKGVGCTVTHVSGSAKAKACFNVVFDCENGVHPRARKCAVVRPGETTEVTLPHDTFSEASACDKATAVHVRKLRVTDP